MTGYAADFVGPTVPFATDGDVTRAVLWQRGVVRDLGTLPGGDRAVALGINAAGQVVGWSWVAEGQGHAFLWKNGVMTDLGTLPGGSVSLAWDINSAGQVVGYSNNCSGEFHAVLWEHGTVTDLGVLPGGASSTAYSINEGGEIVGFSGSAAYRTWCVPPCGVSSSTILQLMSRAFVNEDAGADPLGQYPLPPREDPGFPLAAARALLRGADRGDTPGAEAATGFFFGDPALRPEVEQILAEAQESGDERLEQLAERFLRRAAARNGG